MSDREGFAELLAGLRSALKETHVDIEHLNGVPWHHAPPPPLFHKHWAQTSGWVGLRLTLRCPCGAIGDHHGWSLLDRRRARWFPPFGRRRTGVGDDQHG